MSPAPLSEAETDPKNLALLNWILEKVTEIPRKMDQALTDEDRQILRRATYTSPEGDVVNFGVPDGCKIP